jgi:hypothetical protein
MQHDVVILIEIVGGTMFDPFCARRRPSAHVDASGAMLIAAFAYTRAGALPILSPCPIPASSATSPDLRVARVLADGADVGHAFDER